MLFTTSIYYILTHIFLYLLYYIELIYCYTILNPQLIYCYTILNPYYTIGAVGFWKQATEVTSDLVNIITKPEEEEESFKFPRAQNWEEPKSSSKLSGKNAIPPSSQRATTSSNGSWDNLADLDQNSMSEEHNEHSPYTPYSNTPTVKGIATTSRTTTSNRNTTSNSNNGLSLHPPSSTTTTNAPVMRRNTSSSASVNSNNGGTGSGGSRTPATAGTGASTPSGDDFFANFGI